MQGRRREVGRRWVNFLSGDWTRQGERTRTGTERVVRPLELLAGGVVLAPGGDALEVVGVVLEAARGYRERSVAKGVRQGELVGKDDSRERVRTSASSGFD